jgi:glycine/D-amino acid oxidase-like deaminating enzyme
MASRWTLGGDRQSGRHPAELPLATAAVARWEQLSEELGADVEYQQEGNLRLARSAEEALVIRGMAEEQRTLGLEPTFLPDNVAVRDIAPALAEARVASVWGGLLDLTPDALPVNERSAEVSGLVVAAGFSGHGFCLGLVTGQIVRDLVIAGHTEFPIASFRRDRFARGSGLAAAALDG